MEPEDKFAVINGLRLHYLDWGTRGKPPVLLLHGLAVFARAWDHNARALRDDFDLLPRGTVEVKGKGRMETFLLQGPGPPGRAGVGGERGR